MHLSLGLFGTRATDVAPLLPPALFVWGGSNGTLPAGDILTASRAGVQWQRDGVNIAGETSVTYRTQDIDRGHVIDAIDTHTGARARTSVTVDHAPPTLTGSLADVTATLPDEPISIDVTAVLSVQSDPNLAETTVSLISGQIGTWGTFDGTTLSGTVPAGQETALVFRAQNSGGSVSFAIEVTGAPVVAGPQGTTDIKTYVTATGSALDLDFGPVDAGDMIVVIAEARTNTPFDAADFAQGILREATASPIDENNYALWTHKVSATTPALTLPFTGTAHVRAFNIGAHDFIESDLETDGFTEPKTSPRSYRTIEIANDAKVLRTHLTRSSFPDRMILNPPTAFIDPDIASNGPVSNGVWDNEVTWKTESPVVGTDSLDHVLDFSGNIVGHARIQASFRPLIEPATAQPGVYTTDDNGMGPDGSPLARSAQVDQIQIEDITVDLAQPAQVGHYISGNIGLGDIWIKGPVTITGYTPEPVLDNGRYQNGAMKNIQQFQGHTNERQGFDSRRAVRTPVSEILYDETARAAVPITLEPGDSVLISKSLADGASLSSVYPEDVALENMVVITCVQDVPYADAFRPNYCSHPTLTRLNYRLSDVDASKLTSFAPVGPTPNKAVMYAQWDRFHFDPVMKWRRNNLRVERHKPTYSRNLIDQEGDGLAFLTSTAPLADKLPILIGYVQRGIDCYGVVQSAQAKGNHDVWPADGGHNAGRLPAIGVAEHLLRANWSYPGRWHETDQVFAVNQYAVDYTAGPDWDGGRAISQPYSSGMIGMPEWIISGGQTASPALHFGASWDNSPSYYRDTGNHNVMQGQTLLMASLGAEFRTRFDRDVFFDYAARHLEIEQTGADKFMYRGKAVQLYPMVEQAPAPKPFQADSYATRMLNAHYGTAGYVYPWGEAWTPLS